MSSESSTLRVGIIQMNITTDVQENLDTIAASVRVLQKDQPDLMILPEVCLTGFGQGKDAPTFSEEGLEVTQLTQLAAESGGHLLAGVRILEDGVTYNRALLLNESGIQARYDKRVLFSYWNEHKYFGSGKEPLNFKLGDFNIAPFICYELRFPELFRWEMGAEVMIVIANWPQERRHHWLTLLQARAIENQCYVIGVNRVGEARKVKFVGDSVVFGPLGDIRLELGDQATEAIIDLNLASVTKYRRQFPALKDAPPMWH